MSMFFPVDGWRQAVQLIICEVKNGTLGVVSGLVIATQGAICASYLSHLRKGGFLAGSCFRNTKEWGGEGGRVVKPLFSRITGLRHSSNCPLMFMH